MIEELIRKSRSVRRFRRDRPIAEETLRDLVDLARYSPSGANLQPLKFILSCSPERNEKIFKTLVWAGYLTDWPGSDENERPTAYIVILHDTRIQKTPGCDHGVAAQSIMLGACERGLSGCMVGSIDRARLRRELSISDDYEILLVLALGEAAETVVLEEVEDGGCIEYYRDENAVHHVPKRMLCDVIFPRIGR